MVKRRRVNIGDVFEIPLPDGKYAYGRVYNDASVGIYRAISSLPNYPPIGSRDFLFIVGMYEDILKTGEWEIVGNDAFEDEESSWPPPSFIKDPINGGFQKYYKGEISRSSEEECKGLEETAVWDSHHIIERIMSPVKKDH